MPSMEVTSRHFLDPGVKPCLPSSRGSYSPVWIRMDESLRLSASIQGASDFPVSFENPIRESSVRQRRSYIGAHFTSVGARNDGAGKPAISNYVGWPFRRRTNGICRDARHRLLGARGRT